MPNYIASPLKSKTGIQRDGTKYDCDNYVDGLWCRFYKGRARKMGGYKALTLGTVELVRNMYSVPIDAAIQLYLGRPSSVGYMTIDFDANASGVIDRTPSVPPFEPNPNNQWCFDLAIQGNGTDAVSYIVGQVAPNVLDITSTADGPIFKGLITDNAPLTQILDTKNGNAPVLCSGGIIYSAPILVAYGNNGIIQWTNPGTIDEWSTGTPATQNVATIANTKIIKGYRTRGGNNPALLFWTATSLVRADYAVIPSDDPAKESTVLFSAQTLQDDITVLSPNCIVKYNQMFFWIGIDQFYFFNGIVQKLTNTMSSDFFFDNLNYEYRSKVFGFPVPRYKEIWWCYPRLNPLYPPNDERQPSECTHAIVYNIEEDTWYDTPLPRSAGIPSTTFPYPVMADSSQLITPSRLGPITSYPVWAHELGRDREINGVKYPIQSYFQTHYMTMFANDPQNNVLTRLMRIEPDFDMRGEMTANVYGRAFPQSEDVITGPFTFDGKTEKIDNVRTQARLLSLQYQSYEIGGFYQAGQTIVDYDPGDKVP